MLTDPYKIHLYLWPEIKLKVWVNVYIKLGFIAYGTLCGPGDAGHFN